MIELPTGWYEGAAWWIAAEQIVAVGIVAILSMLAMRALNSRAAVTARSRRR